ncbi:MAG TPA: hypothetical protein VEM76_00210 [Anaeromyxobacteraceae bacterium]|nr:hypothetical protein [Anaeromyxobacteraceae bacterium]
MPTIAASSSACPESSSAEDEASSELAAFCWVTWSIWPIAWVTWSMPAACSFAEAAISATISVTLPIAPTISPNFPET